MPVKSPRVAKGCLGLCTAGCPCEQAQRFLPYTRCVCYAVPHGTLVLGACLPGGQECACKCARCPRKAGHRHSGPVSASSSHQRHRAAAAPGNAQKTNSHVRELPADRDPARTATGENKLGGAGGKFFNSLGKPPHTHLQAPPHRRRDSLPRAGDPRDPPPAPPRSAPLRAPGRARGALRAA